MKKLLALLLSLTLAAGLLAGCTQEPTATDTGSVQTETVSVTEDGSGQFSDGDYKDVSSQAPDAEITLSGNEGTLSDTTRGSSGNTVTITAKGVYRVTGTSENVTIVVNDEKESGNIYLVLDNVIMTNDSAPCITVQAADKVIVQCVGANSLTLTATTAADGADGAIYAKDDLTLNGSGSLTVTSGLHGIVCKHDLKLTGALALTVEAAAIGIQAEDSLRIGGGTALITAGHDGIQIANDTGDSYYCQTAGAVTVNAGYDGLDVGTDGETFTGYLLLAGGSLDVTAGGGSDNSTSETSQKGLKCDGDITVSLTGEDEYLSVSAADDAVNAKGSVTVTAGEVTLSSSDNGITADRSLTLSGGSVTVTKAYEGLEGEIVVLSGCRVSVTASDDGINAGTAITVSDGSVYMNAGGDGLDSNGSIYVTGGTTVIEGPTGDNNGALDKGDGADSVLSITGGTVLALGSAGMAINFDSGTQCAALAAVSGSAGDEIAVDDGSGFSFTASKAFACAVYSSPSLTQGSSYTLTVGSGTEVLLDFSGGLYYTTLSR